MTALRLLETLLSLSLQITLVVTATAYLARRFCRTDGSRDRLWTSCLLAILLLPLADFGLPHLRLLPVPEATYEPQTKQMLERLAPLSIGLAALWGAGAALVLVRRLLGFVLGVRLLRHTTVIASTQLPEPWGHMLVARGRKPAGDVTCPVRFLSTQELISPYCWQLQRATIVLPEFVLAFPADEIAAIIRHELAHVRFLHPLWLFVQRLVEILFWFHPAAHLAARQASRTREFVCDATAAATPAAAASLLRALLRLSHPACGADHPELANLATGEIAGILGQRAVKLGHRDRAAVTASRRSKWGLAPYAPAVAAMLLVWVPIDGAASRRSAWSPWPTWSAHALQTVGIAARDYEIDAHRLRPHRHDR